MPAGPPINTSVTVDVAGWTAPRRTRVEDDAGDEVVIAAPMAEGDDHEPSLGTALDLAWQGGRGPMALRVRLVAKELRTIPTWRLEPDGSVVITQRREHVRTGTVMPAVLHTGSGPVQAHVVDVSEGGLRVAHRGPFPVAVGDRVHVDLAVAERELAVTSEVVRVESDGTTWFAGCRFTAIPEGDADALRRFVFDRQARDRVR